MLPIWDAHGVEYTEFTVEAIDEKMTLFCRTGKEAAKLFGLYIEHRRFLPKLVMDEDGFEVSVWKPGEKFFNF